MGKQTKVGRQMKDMKRGNEGGFSLIELIIVVSVLSILAAIVTPQVTKLVDKAKISRMETDLQAIKTAVSALYVDMGVFPNNAPQSADPGLMSSSRVPYQRRDDWQGPYLDRWPESHPYGGSYDFEYGSESAFNYDRQYGNEVFIIARNYLTSNVLDAIDEDLDDGNRNSGNLRHDGGSYLRYYLAEGPSW